MSYHDITEAYLAARARWPRDKALLIGHTELGQVGLLSPTPYFIKVSLGEW